MTQATVVYPNLIARLGGAQSVRHNAHSAWVKIEGKEIRLPLREVQKALDDGLAVAEIARTYAYRNQ